MRSRARSTRGRTSRRRTAPGRGPSRGRAARRRTAAGAVRGARRTLKSFRQASVLAVAVTGLVFLLLGLDDAGPEPAPALAASPAQVAGEQQADTISELEPGAVAGEALGEAHAAALALRDSFLSGLPQFIAAALVLFLAWLVTRLLRAALGRILGEWERAQATVALSGVGIWLLAIGIAISILVGDVRALVGSLGLVGLALSWALQSPIESFTGWLMNGLRGYYRVGDRIAVGEVMGDVFRIDFLATTVWEIGGPNRPGVPVAGEQPTGRLITFPNHEVLNGSIVNFTRDFAWVWDELTMSVANESDVGYAMQVLQEVAEEVVGAAMEGPAVDYERILRERRLEREVPHGPQVFVSLADSWTDLTVRYLVDARERRVWKTRLARAASDAFGAPEHARRIIPAYPRRQVMFVGADGHPRDGIADDARGSEA